MGPAGDQWLDKAQPAGHESQMAPDSALLISVAEIVWINLVLSGDNAVVIALACRSLPSDRQMLGLWLGAAAAVGLRIVFTAIVASLLGVPFIKIVGGALLIWIAVKLLIQESEETDTPSSQSLWGAVRIIVVADMVMSLDNVLAIAAAAHGSMALIVFGLLLSAPLVVFGAKLMVGLLTRFPAFVWGGAALLGWVAGELIIADHAWGLYLRFTSSTGVEYAAAAAGALMAVGAGWIILRREGRDV